MTSTTARRTGALGLCATAATALLATGAPSAAADSAPGNADLATVRAATAKYHDVDVALTAGYVPVGHCEELPGVGAMGIHYMNPTLVTDPAIDPLRPEVLLYTEKSGGGLRLVGVEYFVADVGQAHPQVLGRDFDGPMAGHSPGMPEHYDLHLWIWKHNPAGVDAAWNPALSCD